MQEVAPDQPLSAIAGVARAAIVAEFAIQPHALIFIPPGQLPRTGSGKVQRGETRRRYERGDLDVLYTSTLADRELAVPYVAPRTEIEQTLTAIWEDVLGFTPIGVDDTFGAVGGHSLKACRSSRDFAPPASRLPRPRCAPPAPSANSHAWRKR